MKDTRINGFSMVDAVLSIVLVGVGFMALATVLSYTSLKNAELDFSTTAVLLAREKMAEEKVLDFSNITDVATTNFSGEFNNYTYSVNVDYVEDTDLNTPAPGTTAYKRIEVIVGANDWTGAISLYDLAVEMP